MAVIFAHPWEGTAGALADVAVQLVAGDGLGVDDIRLALVPKDGEARGEDLPHGGLGHTRQPHDEHGVPHV